MNSSHSRLRCKPGDKAVIVSGRNVGLIVLVVAAYEEGTVFQGYEWPNKADGSRWVVKSLGSPLKNELCARQPDGSRQHAGWCNDQTAVFPDRQLQPLRKRRAKDETLEWMEVPTATTTSRSVPSIEPIPEISKKYALRIKALSWRARNVLAGYLDVAHLEAIEFAEGADRSGALRRTS